MRLLLLSILPMLLPTEKPIARRHRNAPASSALVHSFEQQRVSLLKELQKFEAQLHEVKDDDDPRDDADGKDADLSTAAPAPAQITTPTQVDAVVTRSVPKMGAGEDGPGQIALESWGEEFFEEWSNILRQVSTRPEDGAIASFAKVSLADAPECLWNSQAPAYPRWNATVATKFDDFLESMRLAGLHPSLSGGTLLGAYRHQGTIPFDEDMDMYVSLCAELFSGPLGVFGETPRLAHPSPMVADSCSALQNRKKNLSATPFHKWVWDELLAPVLEPEGIVFVKAVKYGLRLSNGNATWDGGLPSGLGVGVDVPIVLDDKYWNTHLGKYQYAGIPSDVCKCRYGNTSAYCLLNTTEILKEKYGDNFMTPLSQCDYYRRKGWVSAHSEADCKAWVSEAKPSLTEAEAEMETEAKTNAEANAEAETEADTETNAEANMEAETEADTETNAKANMEAENEAETEANT